MSLHEIHVPSRDEVYAASARPLPAGLRLAALVATAIGVIVFIAGLFLNPDRAWQALHFNWLFFTLISSGGVMFAAAQRITTARWSRPVIRFIEGYVAFLPVAFVLLALTVLVGRHHVFNWARETVTVSQKALYLSPGFFTARVLLTFLIITALSLWFVWTSVRLDVGGSPETGSRWARGWRERMRRGFRDERREIHSTHSLQGKLAVCLALAFGLGWPLLSFDLSMSLDLHFQSTLYGWWAFMGGWLGGLMLFALLTMAWRRFLGAYELVTEQHFHDIGKLCFAFTAFWGYLTFGQYLIIWYGNMAEETHWMRLRLIAPWLPVTLFVVTAVFVLPFFGLLSRSAKVFLPTMAFFAVASLIGLWFLRYMEVYPSLHPQAYALPFGLWEIGVLVGYIGLWALCYLTFMEAFPRMRVTLMTSPFRDEVQVPVDPDTMEPLPAHE